ncbi:hypothetical protein [Kutzneria sp. CA-103260]|uniref:hypothetical protein n=1 Tax=Kutzneria sp. CA-103260 TaxID=2802641 RepID=UPI001BAB2CDA|nr:hypothetical protein [Kutzneria sp. CA-103260]QUQ67087.1 hypothetical protein JJ691_48190 [Kutzneria sp. CA-103260]
MIDAVAVALPALELAWDTRPLDQRLPYWERTHVRLAVRQRVTDLEDTLFATASTLSAAVSSDVDF